jgi:PHD/YefM family antitoxin component YafN of YafNO toxin-antitoxin module
MDSFGETALSKKLADKLLVRIAENEKNLEKIENFKSKLYNNLVLGLLEKDDYSKLKARYTDESKTLEEAISILRHGLEEVKENRSEKLRWLEHFKRFENISSLDRKTVVF